MVQNGVLKKKMSPIISSIQQTATTNIMLINAHQQHHSMIQTLSHHNVQIFVVQNNITTTMVQQLMNAFHNVMEITPNQQVDMLVQKIVDSLKIQKYHTDNVLHKMILVQINTNINLK